MINQSNPVRRHSRGSGITLPKRIIGCRNLLDTGSPPEIHFDSGGNLYFNAIEIPETVLYKASEIMRMSVSGSIWILIACTAASALSAERGDTATLAPRKTFAVEPNA